MWFKTTNDVGFTTTFDVGRTFENPQYNPHQAGLMWVGVAVIPAIMNNPEITLMKKKHIMRRFLLYCILVAVNREILLQEESSSI